jgi:hypothetical protein
VQSAYHWDKTLYTWMKLGSGEPQIFHSPLDLDHRAITFMGIDAGKAHKLSRVAPYDLGDRVVTQWFLASHRLGVPGEQHADDILAGIVVGDFFNVAQLHFNMKVLFGRGSILADSDVHKFSDRQMHVEIDGSRHLYSPPLLPKNH